MNMLPKAQRATHKPSPWLWHTSLARDPDLPIQPRAEGEKYHHEKDTYDDR